jgi:hypothetical protein
MLFTLYPDRVAVLEENWVNIPISFEKKINEF